jgi:DNA-binding SARP family transcriptional activator
MDFRLLGPLEVAEQGRSLALGGVKQRPLSAVSCFSWSPTGTAP